MDHAGIKPHRKINVPILVAAERMTEILPRHRDHDPVRSRFPEIDSGTPLKHLSPGIHETDAELIHRGRLHYFHIHQTIRLLKFRNCKRLFPRFAENTGSAQRGVPTDQKSVPDIVRTLMQSFSFPD